MTIADNDFKLIPINNDYAMFDLQLKPTKGTEWIKSYGLPLLTALRKIAHYRTQKGFLKEAVNINTYYDKFAEQLDLLMNKYERTAPKREPRANHRTSKAAKRCAS